MKPHIKRSEVYLRFEERSLGRLWCVIPKDGEHADEYFGHGETVQLAWDDYLLERRFFTLWLKDPATCPDTIEEMIKNDIQT